MMHLGRKENDTFKIKNAFRIIFNNTRSMGTKSVIMSPLILSLFGSLRDYSV